MDGSGMRGNKTLPDKTIGWLWGFLFGFITNSVGLLLLKVVLKL